MSGAKFITWPAFLLLALFLTSLPLDALARGPKRIHRTRKNSLTFRRELAVNVSGVASTPIIRYYGGPLLTAPVLKIYIVYYGLWNEPKKNIIRGFLNSLTRSDTTPRGKGLHTAAGWWNLVTKYFDSSKHFVSKKIVIAKEAVDLYSQGRALTKDDQGQIYAVVTNQFRRGGLPVNPNGWYLVLTDRTVSVGDQVNGFCGTGTDSYCGFHSYDNWGNDYIYYGFVGNAITQCPDACISTGGAPNTPNGDIGVDGMLDLVAHELGEAASNPDSITGWETSDAADGLESADLCEYTFGGEQKDARRNFVYNLVGQNSRKFYIQQMWDRRVQACRLNDAVQTAPA